MPWKGARDPYLIWLSEVILQQTRVEQGWAYFERMRERWPRVQDLASATEEEVLKMWEGLGYYSRARNLHATARAVVDAYGGAFPPSYEALVKLKGIGPYTAAAIASFAWNMPHAVVDGNVIRILARVFGTSTPMDTTEGKRTFHQLADQLLDPAKPAAFNQAMMDLGALVCRPLEPLCGQCPLSAFCFSKKHNCAREFPRKSRKPKRRQRHFVYLEIHARNGLYIKRRSGKDIWKHLYELPLIETHKPVKTSRHLQTTNEWKRWFGNAKPALRLSTPITHELTHQRIVARFGEVRLNEDFCLHTDEDWILVEKNELAQYPFPRLIQMHLEQIGLI
ncbi:MAG: A/G-specific adenine glycosylase [Saprospiraceae bacterium]|nr:MAG: A/G-specific adenine glycosylase [Saprospiraceae bacterium]